MTQMRITPFAYAHLLLGTISLLVGLMPAASSMAPDRAVLITSGLAFLATAALMASPRPTLLLVAALMGTLGIITIADTGGLPIMGVALLAGLGICTAYTPEAIRQPPAWPVFLAVPLGCTGAFLYALDLGPLFFGMGLMGACVASINPHLRVERTGAALAVVLALGLAAEAHWIPNAIMVPLFVAAIAATAIPHRIPATPKQDTP